MPARHDHGRPSGEHRREGDAAAPRIGLVSDTHGHYAERLDAVFAGVVHIVHAGDVGTLDVLERLRQLAPVTAVAGNVDLPALGATMPWEAQVTAAGLRILVCHIGASLMGRHDPAAEGYDLVVSGHSHRPRVELREGVLYVNPGSAGRPRFGLPSTCALVTVGPAGSEAEIVALE